MIKKILIGFLGVLLVGVLVFGAVNRTMAWGNYPNAGQRYGQHNANFGAYQGWAGQERTAMQGDGWHGSDHGRGQHIAEERPLGQKFRQLHRGQSRGVDRPWEDGTSSLAPWD